jgi:hypothetical protein
VLRRALGDSSDHREELRAGGTAQVRAETQSAEIGQAVLLAADQRGGSTKIPPVAPSDALSQKVKEEIWQEAIHDAGFSTGDFHRFDAIACGEGGVMAQCWPVWSPGTTNDLGS